MFSAVLFGVRSTVLTFAYRKIAGRLLSAAVIADATAVMNTMNYISDKETRRKNIRRARQISDKRISNN